MGKLSTAVAFCCIVLAGSGAQAADLQVKAPPPPIVQPVPMFSWTGFYLGANLGGAWAHRNIHDSRFGLTYDRSSDSRFIGGGQFGYNYQIGSFVVGIEGDADAVARNRDLGNGVVIPAVGTIVANSSGSSTIATLAARFGIANGNWLIYGKAGGGWVSRNDLTITNVTTGTSIVAGGRTQDGALLGVGVEWVFAGNWTGKIEYDHLGLGSQSFAVPAGSPFLVGDVFTRSTNVQMVKIGVNYLLNTGRAGY